MTNRKQALEEVKDLLIQEVLKPADFEEIVIEYNSDLLEAERVREQERNSVSYEIDMSEVKRSA